MLALCTAKFTASGTRTTILDTEKECEIQSFPGVIDTQSFDRVGDSFAVLHHQHHKDPRRSAVELIEPGAEAPYASLPEADELKFPTVLVSNADYLVVGCNGTEFKGALFIYKLQDAALPRLIRRIPLTVEQSRPTGLALEGETVFLASYSAQKIWSFDIDTGQPSFVLDVSRFGQTTPMGLALTDEFVFVLGHVDSSLTIYSRKYGLPVQIIREGLDYPWSLLIEEDDVVVANRGRRDHNGDFTSRIARFDSLGCHKASFAVEGVTVLRP